MIQANELRIWAIVQHKWFEKPSFRKTIIHREQVSVLAIDGENKRVLIKPKQHRKNHTWVSLATIHPIPLSEEVLLKCGFEKCEKHDNFYQIVLNDWTKIYVAFHDKQYAVELSVSKHSFCPNVKYLHQLQNIYHALTGQEIKIEL